MNLVNPTNVAASAVISAVPGYLCGAVVAAGTDAATLIIYDNASAGTGTVLLKLAAAIGTTVVFAPPFAVRASLGLYATISGATPGVTVFSTP